MGKLAGSRIVKRDGVEIKKVGETYKETWDRWFPAKNPMMGSEKQRAIDELETDLHKKQEDGEDYPAERHRGIGRRVVVE